MAKNKTTPVKPVNPLHPNNPHQGRYDFAALVHSQPLLAAFLRENPSGGQTVDFADPEAVRCLNQALLAHFYQIKFWQLPPGYLCPPIPGRADYIHYLAELIEQGGGDKKQIKALDIGTGASCIYPIIGAQSYGWRFVASDIDKVSVNVAKTIVQANPGLRDKIKLRLQPDPACIFAGIIGADEYFDVTLCNPPFHASLQQAQNANSRKVKNLGGQGGLNFGGQQGELWCPGGELSFIGRMISQSRHYGAQVGWFSSLVSKVDNIKSLRILLEKQQVAEVRVMKMSQGQKISHLLAWHY